MRVLEKRSKVNNPGILKTTDIPLDEQPHKAMEVQELDLYTTITPLRKIPLK